MYQKVTEPLTVIGTALKEATNVKDVINAISALPPEVRKQLVQEAKKKMKTAEEEVTAGIASKALTTIGLLGLLMGAFGADKVERAITNPDAKAVDTSLTSLLALPAAEPVTLEIKSQRGPEVVKELEALHQAIPKTDPTVERHHTGPIPPEAQRA